MTQIIEQPMELPDKEIDALKNKAFHGDRAREVKEGKDWAWLEQFIFGALNDEAIMILRNARTDEERVKAQQMFLACEKPKNQLQFLINQGNAATASLNEIAILNSMNEEQKEPQNA